MSSPTIDLPPSLLKALDEGRCVLFVGSGVSCGEGIPSAEKLAEALVDEMRRYKALPEILDEAAANRTDLSKIASLYGAVFGGSEHAKRKVCDLIRDAERSSPARFHKQLILLPSLEYIVTTNWDTLIESALPDPGTVTVRRQDEMRKVRQRWTNIYKIHGCISLPDGVVLDLQAYDLFRSVQAAFADLVKTLLRQFVFICVGYSMQDTNFRSLVGEALGTSMLPAGSHFFVLPHEAVLQKAEFEHWGFEHINATALNFIEALTNRYQEARYSPGRATLPIEKWRADERPARTYNPFEMYDTEALALADASKFVQYFVPPIDFNSIIDRHNAVVEGHRGSGKSMVFRYLSLYHEHARPMQLPFWGFYVKLESGFFDAFERRARAEAEWIKDFQHYFNLVVATGIIGNVLEAARRSVWAIGSDAEASAVHAVRARLLRSNEERRENSFADLQEQMYEQLDLMRDDPGYCCFRTSPRFLEALLECLSEAVPPLSQKWWTILLDEWDNLTEDQQMAVVMRLHDRSGKLRFKVAVKTMGFLEHGYGGKTLDLTHDYMFVCLDHHLFDPERKYQYFDFLEKVSDKRLGLAHAEVTRVRDLLPEARNLPKTQYYYAGFEGFAMLSGGLVREFLELAKDAVYSAFPRIAYEPVQLEPIPPKWQDHVARIHSAIHYNNHRGCADSDHVQRLLFVLGTVFRAIDLATANQKEYRKPLSFIVTDMHSASNKTRALLAQAILNRLLQVPSIPLQPRNPQEGVAEKYILHRMLCPLFHLSLFERHHVPLRSRLIEQVYTNPHGVIGALTRTYRGKGINKFLPPETKVQPTLFDLRDDV